jgi:hypothetical protein
MNASVRLNRIWISEGKEMKNIDTLTLQHELLRSQEALEKCTNDQSRLMYRLYIKDLASELLFRYRQIKLAESA